MAQDTTALDEMKVSDLRDKAKEAGITGASHMRKEELVEALGSDEAPSNGATEAGADALTLLIADHRTVEKLFKEALEDEPEDERLEELALQICNELKLHAQVEEEIFYPALKAQAIEEDEDDARDVVLEAYVEHGSVKELIAKIEALSPADESYLAMLQVMSEHVAHHVEEEESEMFDQARELFDAATLEQIGAKITAMKGSANKKASAKKK